MENKITISEFEKILKEIDENVEVVRGGESDYYVKFDEYTTHLCAFVPGTLDNFNIFSANSYDRGISDKVLYKAIELIPHLVPDDYNKPTKDELFKEFLIKTGKKGFYLEDIGSEEYELRYDSPESGRWTIAEFDKSLKDVDVISNEDAPIDKYLEGLKLFISYVEKVRALEKEKKYYLRHKWFADNTNDNYLNLDKSLDEYFVSTGLESKHFKTKFTQKEIEGIKERFGVTLEDFERIEVQDEL